MAPGNDGMTLDGLDLINIGISEHSKLIDFAKANDIVWTFIGPDDALAAGIVDDFTWLDSKPLVRPRLRLSLSGLRILQRKSWSNTTFRQQPMGLFQISKEPRPTSRKKVLQSVVKADGLALGKGVVVAETVEQAVEAAHRCFLDNKFGDSGARVIIEEFLDGEEFSLPLSMGTSSIMPTAQDHKRAYDGDKGPNTGGMGAYAPVPSLLPQRWLTQRLTTIVASVPVGMIEEGRRYPRCPLRGLILTAEVAHEKRPATGTQDSSR